MSPLETGVCTWSLKAADIPTALSTIKDDLGLGLIQLGFFDDSILDEANDDAILAAVNDSGLEVSATCLGFAGAVRGAASGQ